MGRRAGRLPPRDRCTDQTPGAPEACPRAPPGGRSDPDSQERGTCSWERSRLSHLEARPPVRAKRCGGGAGIMVPAAGFEKSLQKSPIKVESAPYTHQPRQAACGRRLCGSEDLPCPSPLPRTWKNQQQSSRARRRIPGCRSRQASLEGVRQTDRHARAHTRFFPSCWREAYLKQTEKVQGRGF